MPTNPNNRPIQLALYDGPSFDKLFESLMRGDNQSREAVYFQAGFSLVANEHQERRVNAHVNGAKREDGSGHSWLITIRVVDHEINNCGAFTFEGIYNTRTRRGSLTVGV